MITGIEHFAVYSNDTAKLKNWYAKTFNFKQVYDNGKGTYFLKAPDGMMIEFIMSDKGEIPADITYKGLRHIALASGDFQADAAALKAAGVEVITEPAVSDKGVGTFFFRDPDGNVVHLISRPEPL